MKPNDQLLLADSVKLLTERFQEQIEAIPSDAPNASARRDALVQHRDTAIHALMARAREAHAGAIAAERARGSTIDVGVAAQPFDRLQARIDKQRARNAVS